MMKVTLIAHTPYPAITSGVAARCCVSEKVPPFIICGDEALKDRKAFVNAMNSGHHSVGEHITFTFAIEGISRACSHQLVRHRVASYSQQSQRYVNMDGFEYVIPESIENSLEEVWSKDAQEVVQVIHAYRDVLNQIKWLYHDLVLAGIPEEDARYILPNACTTNIVMTINLRELIHIAELRLCKRSQWEIRELVQKMVEEVVQTEPMFSDWLIPQCKRLGYCPEKKGCGYMPPRVYRDETHRETNKTDGISVTSVEDSEGG